MVPCSAGDAEDASSEYGNNHKNGSDSDGSIANAGRGRSSVADRRQNDVKREKTEPVPVSPPRKSVIEAGHEAEEGSQIKVKFDTGHWFSGIISKVDKQRCEQFSAHSRVWDLICCCTYQVPGV